MSSISTIIFSIILINYLLGIYNGAKGRIVGFGFSSSNDYVYSTSVLSQDGFKMEIPIVFVKMDQDLGFSILSTMENVVPFTRVLDTSGKYSNNYHRWQLPLTPAFATTTHKMQGSTVVGNCVTLAWDFSSNKTPYTRGLDYVSHSRAKDLSKLFLVNALTVEHFSAHDDETKIVNNEYIRLRTKFPNC